MFESTIQGMHNTTATATIKIKTDYAGILSFDYMVSSEEKFDVFKYEVSGADTTDIVQNGGYTNNDDRSSGYCDWITYAQSFEVPEDGYITLTITYDKDKNMNRNEDKAASSLNQCACCFLYAMVK